MTRCHSESLHDSLLWTWGCGESARFWVVVPSLLPSIPSIGAMGSSTLSRKELRQQGCSPGRGLRMGWGLDSCCTGTGNLVKVEGGMDSNQYQQILETNVQESVTKLTLRLGWIFQQDNDPKHCSKSTNAFMQRNKYNVLEWPSQSPDLNIIENLWCHLKRAVHARKPSNLNELEVFCKEEWSKMPLATIQTLIRSYRKRLEAVISAKGGSTKGVCTLSNKPMRGGRPHHHPTEGAHQLENERQDQVAREEEDDFSSSFCPLCGRGFDLPLLLPCSHTLCVRCITDGAKTSKHRSTARSVSHSSGSVCVVLCPRCSHGVELPCFDWSSATRCLPIDPTVTLDPECSAVMVQVAEEDEDEDALRMKRTGVPVLHQWTQDTAHRTLAKGNRPQDTAHRMLPTGRCPLDAAHRTLATGNCPQDTAHWTLPTGRCPQDTVHKTLPTGRCPQDAAHRTLPTGHCPQDTVHKTLPTGRCPQDSTFRMLPSGCCPQDGVSRTLTPGSWMAGRVKLCLKLEGLEMLRWSCLRKRWSGPYQICSFVSSGLIFALDSSSAAPPLHLTSSALTATFKGDSRPLGISGGRCRCPDSCAALPQVCGNVAIHRGQYYWEVDVCNSALYRIGVSSSAGDQAWWMERCGSAFHVVFDGRHELLPSVPPQLKTVGVFLNVGGSSLTFHNPLTRELLAAIPSHFTPPLYPAIQLGQGRLKLRPGLPPPNHIFLSCSSAYRGPGGAGGGRWRRDVAFGSVRTVIQKFEEMATSDSDSGLMSSCSSSSTLASLPEPNAGPERAHPAGQEQ
ncbi:hypothetical protein NFI96_023697 [Prochilodus magdalenae]|nr:hypothetical protein NFI96_023697 [Prochilodus magdalenae]